MAFSVLGPLLLSLTLLLPPSVSFSLSDAEAAVDRYYREIKAAAPAQAHCFTKPKNVIWDPSVTGGYRPKSQTIRLGSLRPTVVVHELAHHLDYVCGARSEIGAAFRKAQGVRSDYSWTGGNPVASPSEFFANSVVKVLGYPTGHKVRDGAVAVTRAWMRGTAVPSPKPKSEPKPESQSESKSEAPTPSTTTTTLPPTTTTTTLPPPPPIVWIRVFHPWVGVPALCRPGFSPAACLIP